MLKELSGEVLQSYIKNNYNLTSAVTDIFISYYESERSKGYRRPKYPHRLWTNIINSIPDWKRSESLVELGVISKHKEGHYLAKNYCSDMSQLRQRFENYKQGKWKFQNESNEVLEMIQTLHL